MSDIEYPALKIAADDASACAQRTFICLSKVQLSLLVITGFISGWSPPSTIAQRIEASIVFLLMTSALATEVILRTGRFDDRWFRCRALAENVKSAVWFFVMESPSEITRKRYRSQVAQIEERLNDLAKELSLHGNNGDLVTGWMQKTQLLPIIDKVALFRTERVEEQRQWYLRKAAENTSREHFWFWCILIVEFVAIAYAALQIFLLWQFNAVGGIAGLSASCIAWIQLKRFSDLGTSYSIAAGDLRRIADEHVDATDSHQLASFVEDVEAAVSREHSLWLARRST